MKVKNRGLNFDDYPKNIQTDQAANEMFARQADLAIEVLVKSWTKRELAEKCVELLDRMFLIHWISGNPEQNAPDGYIDLDKLEAVND